MWMSFGRAAPRRAPAAREPSLYRDWMAAPDRVMASLAASAFSLAEAAEAEAWATRQRDWGLGLRLRRGPDAAARVIEVHGPDGCAPLALLYRGADGGLRVDGWAGEVHGCASLSAALGTVLACV